MDTIFIILVLLFYYIGKLSSNEELTQTVRLADVFIYGPILTYVAYMILNNKSQNIHKILGYLILFMGVTTISYNLNRYLKKKNIKDT